MPGHKGEPEGLLATLQPTYGANTLAPTPDVVVPRVFATANGLYPPVQGVPPRYLAGWVANSSCPGSWPYLKRTPAPRVSKSSAVSTAWSGQPVALPLFTKSSKPYSPVSFREKDNGGHGPGSVGPFTQFPRRSEKYKV